MSFDPMPKRERVLANNSLELRAMPENLESMPYQKALYSLDDMYMLVAEQEIMEQPDADLVTYES